jgi:hypothetical protein
METDATILYNDLGIPVICQEFFERHVAAYGSPPGRNYMLRAAELSGFSEHQIRTSWEVLSGRRRAAPRRYKLYRKGGRIVTAENGQQEAEVQDSEATEAEDEVTSLAIGLVKQQKRITVLEQTVRELRELTMQMPTKALPMPHEVVVAVGRAQADIARLSTQQQRLHDRVDGLTSLLAAMQHTIAPLQTLRDLLTKDKVAWDTVLPMVMQHDRPYAEKAVRNWLEGWTGRPLYKPTM